jgi:hypothetical protein
MLQERPEQQSPPTVQLAVSPWQGVRHTPPSQVPEQHWPFESQALPFGAH